MNYWLWLRRRDGTQFVCHGAFLPGLIPEHVVAMLTVAFAEEMHLCRECCMDSRCHVIGPSGVKYCTVLFHDAVRPTWRLEAVA